MITEVKAESLKYTVENSFLWNSTYLSDTKSKTRGIGAAQQWVKSEFDKYALESNGRLTSKIDYFYKADGRRIAVDSQLGNVMATLKELMLRMIAY
jgi:hypothetical protein